MMRSLLAAIALAVTSSGPQEQPNATANSGEVRDCIDVDMATVRRAVDERTILFERVGDQSYLNRLSGRCPGLRRASHGFGVLAFDMHGSRLCRGDMVRVLDPSSGLGLAEYRSAIACPLGPFVLEPEGREEAAE